MFGNLTGWQIIISLLLLLLATFVLWLVALIQIAQSRAPGGIIALWIVIITLIYLIGPILWFAVGKRTVTQPTASQQADR